MTWIEEDGPVKTTREYIEELKAGQTVKQIATIVFAGLIQKPHGVNEEVGPDYEGMAKEARMLAETAAPYLIKELSGLPAQGEGDHA